MARFFDLFTKGGEEKQELQQITQQLKQLSDTIKNLQENVQSLEKEIKENKKEILKLRMTQEDSVELLEEISEDQKSALKKEEIEKREIENLLILAEMYEENFWHMKEYAKEHDDSIYEQFCFVENKLENSKVAGETAFIEQEMIPLDYELHQVVEVYSSACEKQDKMIAKVFSPGMIYKGKVRKKAKVAVYRWEGTGGGR